MDFKKLKGCKLIPDKYKTSARTIISPTAILFLALVCIVSNTFASALKIDASKTSITEQITQNKEIEIKGFVYDENRTPLPGATVKENGAPNFVVTDKAGAYTIKLKAKDSLKLAFSYIGMKTQIITVGKQTKIDAVLLPISTTMQEVVITGFGNIKKDEYTGSANVINAEDIGNRAVGTFENVLAGLSPGVTVSSSGQPGDIAEVRLRGFGSMSSSSQPLYVIDGIVFDQDNTSGHSNAMSSPMATINPSDIANITILKDAASASLYGSQGANGVIVITTKKGAVSDRMRYNFSAQTGISNVFASVKPEFVTAEQYKMLWTEGQLHRLVEAQGGDFVGNLTDLYQNKLGNFLNGKNFYQWQKDAQQAFNTYYAIRKPDGTYHDYDFFGADSDKLPHTDWYDEITRTAKYQQYDFSMNGGSTNLKYYLSLGYLDQEGVIVNSGLKRYSLNLNLNADDRSKLINWGLKTNISATDQSGPLTSGASYVMPHYAALLLPSVVPAYLEDGSYNFYFPNNLLNGSHNPIASANQNIKSRPQFSLFTSGWLRVNFKKWLDLTSDVSQYYITGHRVDYFDKDFGSGYGSNGSLTDYSSRRVKITNRNMLNFNYTINNRHRFNATAGLELTDFEQTWTSITAVNFMSNEKPVLATGSEISGWDGNGYAYSMQSLVSKVDYSYRYRYFLSGSYRQDKSSRFSPDRRTGDFWSVSGAYRITNEPWAWLKPIKKYFNDIKFKASYGYNGALPSRYYGWQTLFNGTGVYNAEQAIFQTYRSNPDLTWEKNRIVNLGLDFGMFKDKLRVSAEYYRRNSSDLLQDVPVSNTTGYTTMLMNTSAGIINKGFELDLNAKVIDKDVKWNVKFNIATLSSKYYGLEQDIIASHIMRNGKSVASWYTNEYAGINSITGEILYYAYNAAGNKVISDADNPSYRVIVGKGIPTATGGLSNLFKYKGWELSTLMTYGLGHMVSDTRKSSRTAIDGVSMDYNLDVSQLDRWNPDNIYGTARIRKNGQLSAGGGTRYMYSGDYLKFKNIKLSHTFPPSTFRKMGVNAVGLFTQVENLGVLTELKGYDPDLQLDGLVNMAKYPTSTTFTFGINMNF